MKFPTDRKYSETHEWFLFDGDIVDEVSPFIEVSDHEQGEPLLVLDEVRHPHLLQQVVEERRILRQRRLDAGQIVGVGLE